MPNIIIYLLGIWMCTSEMNLYLLLAAQQAIEASYKEKGKLMIEDSRKTTQSSRNFKTQEEVDKYFRLVWFDGKNIWQAASQGDLATLQAIIKQGGDVNAEDDEDMTPLAYAAEKGQTEAAQLLLDQGAAVDEEDLFGWTPLMLAAEGGHTETVRLLIKRGADVNAEDPNNPGDTALAIATRKGHASIIRLLKEAGAQQ